MGIRREGPRGRQLKPGFLLDLGEMGQPHLTEDHEESRDDIFRVRTLIADIGKQVGGDVKRLSRPRDGGKEGRGQPQPIRRQRGALGDGRGKHARRLG